MRLGTNGTPGGELLAQALDERGVGSEQVAELRELLGRIDRVRYGATTDAAGVLAGRILQWAEAADPILARGTGS